ncbi:Dyp-type peroxidase [Wielerella bovis]|uniref:Dyp-type peroxidase n=1 Tax=Wielerella bovis TaxID=2917790 RepID=UPI00201995C0|nr:Dyp-type peroxidase [Wielerella bovis]MCG7657872.1 Dyp-type peroxidase [Wielerella bovis]MCG7660094.1 Dyp-type peroxidase [Wielerella bovis]ULJ60110.1 Dyp-type peroxidase [Wielerella bovis]
MKEILLNEHAQFGLFIEANIKQPEKIAAACALALDKLAHIQARYPEDQIGLSIAFGADFWGSLKHAAEAPELKNFPTYGKGNTHAPATQHDLLLHIQSNHHDSNFTLAMDVLAAFGTAIEVCNETHGFRRHQERGLDGFVDGTENPHGAEKILSIGLNEHGGSYVLMQRYRHDLAKWNTYSIAEQEESVARSKESNEEFSKDIRHPRSHIARTNIKEDGKGLKIVRRSLPYGTASGEHGLAFIAYAGTLHNIEAQLQHMFGDVADGQTDLLLERLTQAVSGAYYYAPSETRLRQL